LGDPNIVDQHQNKEVARRKRDVKKQNAKERKRVKVERSWRGKKTCEKAARSQRENRRQDGKEREGRMIGRLGRNRLLLLSCRAKEGKGA